MNKHQHSRFHSRGYEQPPHRRACGTTKLRVTRRRPLQQQRWSRGERCHWKALVRVPSRGTRTSHQSQRAGGRSAGGAGGLVGGETFSSGHHLSTDDGSHLPIGRSPLKSSRMGEHRPPREASCRSEGRTNQEHERRPSGVRRLGRSPGAHGATAARTTGQRGADRPQASSAPACLARWLSWIWRSFRCHLPPLGRSAPSPLNAEGRGGPLAHTGGRALAQLAPRPSKDDEDP
jgi:hypothetical protein